MNSISAKMEPEAGALSDSELKFGAMGDRSVSIALISAAISLKRIAAALELANRNEYALQTRGPDAMREPK